jgi:copper chaperone CopZ
MITRNPVKLSILLAAAILPSLLWTGGCATTPRNADRDTASLDETPVAGREAVLTVYGMSCPLCANNVDKMLLEIPGVTVVNVDMGTGEARVSFDGSTPVTRRQLAEAIDRSGFTLQRIDIP